MVASAAVWYPVLGAAIAISLGVVYYLAQPGGRWGHHLRQRFVLGIPWGTLLTVTGVVAFYLVVQDGYTNPNSPVVIPFRAWSYFYPTGILVAGFSHGSLPHLIGNMLGTVVFGSLAEYGWSHFPTRRGETTFSSLRTNPFIRIAVFTVALFAIAIFTAAFALGPVVGFSGVVFALIGFAIIRYPLTTIAALLISRVINLVFTAVREPWVQQTAGETFSQPWWAEVAIQGHMIGLFAGAVVAIGLAYRRDRRPTPSHIWVAVLVFAVDRGLWAIYIIEDSDTFLLYRALGTALVFLLAALLAGGAAATPRTLIARIDLSRREAAYGLVVATFLALAIVGIPFNLFAVDDASTGLADADPVVVEDYTVFYAEDIENQFVPAVHLPIGGMNESQARVNASGIIIVSEARNIWWEEVSDRRLAAQENVRLRLGGLSWSRDVRATRTTWRVPGGEATYHVRLGPTDAAERPVVFRAASATAVGRIDGRNISIEPVASGFGVNVTRQNQSLGRAPIPAAESTTTVGGVTFSREGRDVFAERGETRVRIAQRGS